MHTDKYQQMKKIETTATATKVPYSVAMCVNNQRQQKQHHRNTCHKQLHCMYVHMNVLMFILRESVGEVEVFFVGLVNSTQIDFETTQFQDCFTL